MKNWIAEHPTGSLVIVCAFFTLLGVVFHQPIYTAVMALLQWNVVPMIAEVTPEIAMIIALMAPAFTVMVITGILGLKHKVLWTGVTFLLSFAFAGFAISTAFWMVSANNFLQALIQMGMTAGFLWFAGHSWYRFIEVYFGPKKVME